MLFSHVRVARPDCSGPVNSAVASVFNSTWDAASALAATAVSDSAKPPYKLSVVVENIDGSDSFRFAAAEVVRQYFSDFLTIDPQGAFILYIAGTDKLGVSGAQYIDVRVVTFSNHSLIAGETIVPLRGQFIIAYAGKAMTGYSAEERTQIVRELLYKVLSEFRSSWTEASAKGRTIRKSP